MTPKLPLNNSRPNIRLKAIALTDNLTKGPTFRREPEMLCVSNTFNTQVQELVRLVWGIKISSPTRCYNRAGVHAS